MTSPSEPGRSGDAAPRRRAPRSAARATTGSSPARRSGRAAAGAGGGGPTVRRSRRNGTDAAAPGPGDFPAPWPARRRSGRVLYDRAAQRRHEQWSPLGRSLSWLFGRPEIVLAATGSPPPVEFDGRVLHRGVQALLQLMARAPGAGSGPWDGPAEVALARRRVRQVSRFVLPLRTDVYSTGRVVPGADGAPPVPVRVYRRFGAVPEGGRPRPPAIVFFHGGGWVVGDVESYERHCRLLAAVTRCTVVSVEYRLAPEHPFPAAVDDALAAYRWTHRHAEELGAAAGQVAVMGDSAGGNLAAVVALLTRPGGRGSGPDLPPPLVQGLVYPAVDARMGTESHRDLAADYALTRDGMDYFRSCYLPEEADWLSPEASPLLADDHRGVAPALVVTAGFDPLRDEGTAYAGALRGAGVPVTERCYDDQIHGFLSMGIVPDCLALTVEVFDAMGRMVRAAAEAGGTAAGDGA